ncbi:MULTISPECIES: glutamine--fructose-6-phosphate transaminase (isomerizing) [Staphylococcus]|jgi:glucosamine--fructose-6-phosphate aminotransferase (isomerizing)|uniref:Glutamine--fructose-6-phosphate aminotransferase [isomerizing] n=1 Tax=Staphylococcus nepalensis TaxID=214473 RepID=A0A291JII9_9STAP|nr:MULTISPECIES: glutamine--fructose-6-phosphate transaminase (isomerizing) [Staphylococcus]VDG66510.1 glucosamine--fructose-6-phosphate aminotransferase [Lacrimispora indolis]ATH59559.1 glutamine--fructose-6-phosphate aminotransferase [Staphylococcus nepalensis]ATH64650.1 glutamine--fructose-6-phosphate aminotransferase [Staphylococcus nepalensis]MBO1222600.1 glutamine--fructose-6-phosphate transaminase (isomerizing) [Staphylococcus nepalensis]NWN86587.1 glutamine--fructose-6-phosphate transa
MCGIVGYIGHDNAKELLLKGLEKLEYRGYDSAGIAVVNDEGTNVFKSKGRIAELRKVADSEDIDGNVGIGHTRWATHGVPNYENSHPHQSATNRFTLVHNGVIENYEELSDAYLSNVTFLSETDTEIIVQLVEYFSDKGLSTEAAFTKVVSLLEGSYALGLIDSQDRDTMYVAKNKSPLLIGVGDGFNVIASDALAMLQVTNQYKEIHDHEIVIVKRDEVVIKDQEGNIQNREAYTAQIDAADAEKGVYDHYMLKEIHEQPAVMRRIIQEYQDDEGNLKMDADITRDVANADRIYIIAAGTSYHAGLVGKEYLEKWAGVPTEVHVASEFVYNMPLLSEKPLFIYISQSGETADSRAVLVETKKLGHKSLTITNVPGSTLSREADHTLLLHAGPEIAVASTKAYTAQIAVLSILSQIVAKEHGREADVALLRELAKVTTAIETIVDDADVMEQIATDFLETTRNAFFIGRTIDYNVSLEGALKLKEISYIQAEGFAGGELKHGTIALIEEGTPVIALATQENVNPSIRGNVKEVAARGANPCIISMDGLNKDGDTYVIPHVHELLTPLVAVVAMQLISYYAALHRDLDVDKPRNLAKSVTVE